MAKEDNLIPVRTKEEAREKGRNGGIKSGQVRKEKKFMTQIYAEFLEKEHGVIGKDGLKKNMTGNELLSSVMSKILSRGDSASVSLMKEIREATEGSKVNINTEPGALTIQFLPVTTEKDDSKIPE